METALIILDIQKEYFAVQNGGYPLWNADKTLQNILNIIHTAQNQNWEIIGIQHQSMDPQTVLFNRNSDSSQYHPSIASKLKEKPLFTKSHADAFYQTGLLEYLKSHNIQDIYLCGMMTQNCITHTALSPYAKEFTVHILGNACTAPTQAVHQFAIRALQTYFDVILD